LDFIIKVAHNSRPNEYQNFCRITEYNATDEVIDEICNLLNESSFRDCTFIHEEAEEV